MLNKERSAERPRKELSARTVLFGVGHGENSGLGEVGELLVPCALQEARANLVDFLEILKVGDGDFPWRNSDNRAILLVQRINVENSLTSNDGSLRVS